MKDRQILVSLTLGETPYTAGPGPLRGVRNIHADTVTENSDNGNKSLGW